ncbi:MAG: type II secretion system protein GspG [bacterium]|nr:type II secretion system protein GspG [bacterium]
MKHAATPRRSGFGLMGLVVLLAVMAILAGTVGPLLFREYVAARETETRVHLERLDEALVGFYRDVGRLPDEAEGLAVLVTDPGLGGWRGPYLDGGRDAAATVVALDAWNRPLVYDLAPLLDTGQAAALIASGGGDHRLGAGTVGGLWTTAGTAPGTPGHDDLLMLVDLGSAALGLEAVTRERLEAISAAAQEHFRLQGAFPVALADLHGAWLPPSFGADALVDGWGVPFSYTVDALARPPVATVGSRGADGLPGTADDQQLGISSAAAGRRTTSQELASAQSRLDAQPSLDLEGVWDLDRANLGLDGILAADGWGTPYAIRVSTRTVVSAGPDGNFMTAADNLPPGVVPDAP